MKRILLGLALAFVCGTTYAQYEYHLTGRNDVPVTGRCHGFIGGGYTAMLKNRDDIDADKRLDLETMNFTWGAGYEQMWWFQPSIGFGFQTILWNGGGAYSGLIDSANNITMKANTTLNYIKIPFLFYFKSYNRYHPDRAVRFNACFGPYIALNSKWSDQVKIYDKDGNIIGGSSVSSSGSVDFTGNNTGEYSSALYKGIEMGFVTGMGGEIRISRRTVLSLMVRVDVGISDVENKRKNKFKLSNSSVEIDSDPWKGLYAKYTQPNALDVAAGWESNRPATKNFAVGAFVTYRKYFNK